MNKRLIIFEGAYKLYVVGVRLAKNNPYLMECYWKDEEGVVSATHKLGVSEFDDPHGLFRKPTEEELEHVRKWYKDEVVG